MGRLRPPLRLVYNRFGGWTPGLGFGSPTPTPTRSSTNIRTNNNSNNNRSSSYSTKEGERIGRGRRPGMLGGRAKVRFRCMGSRKRR